MRRPLPALVLGLAILCARAPAPGSPIAFPQAESDLRPDPAAMFGTLPNGLRYVVMPNHEPKARASLRLLVLAGSLEETQEQRGLAHFLEHMAFNGSTHYPHGTLVEKLQRLGMGFGADTNASTSFERTLYQLDLPDTAQGTLQEGLQILADYGGGLLLEQSMVDKERGIILSEKRARDSIEYRTMVSEMEFMEAGTRVPERLPIGLEDIIQRANRDPFVAFYDAWYRPDLMVVIVVGDVDPAAVQKMIADGFSGLAPRGPEPAYPDLGQVASFVGVRGLYHPEPEAPDTEVVIASTTPYAHEPDTAADRLKHLPRSLAVKMVNRRLEILAKRENAPFIKGSVGVEESFNLYRDAEMELECRADQWRQGLGVADQELRRALQYGFRADELKEAVASLRNTLDQAARTAATRRSDDLAGAIADSLVDREVFTSPADDLALFGPALERVTPADCWAAFKQAWSSPGRYVFVAGNAKILGDASNIVTMVYNRAEAVPVNATNNEGRLEWGYSSFGPAGAVASRTHVDDLDITEVTFSNGVRLNLKKTDFEADMVHVAARLGTGQLTEPAATEPGLSTFANVTFTAGGLGKLSVDDLQRVTAGRTVGVQFSSTPDAFVLGGQTSREDLELEFQLLAASIADPGYRPEALRVARKRIDAAYLSFEHTERGPLTLRVAALLASGDPRFGLPSKDQMMARNLDELREWLAPQLASGALEVSVAGDIDIDKVVDVASRTVGALPAREAKPVLEDRRRVSFPSSPFTRDYGIDTQIPKGVVAVYWPTNDGMDIHRARRLNLLAEVLADRLRVKVREQLGSTYSPNVGSSASDVYPGYGFIAAVIIVDPAKIKQIEDVVVAVAGDMSSSGVSEDELDRAKNPTLTAVRETERSNAYWMTVLGKAQEKPEVLDWARSRRADFQAISKAEIDALAKAYLAPDRASRVTIHPYAAPAASPVIATPPPDGM